MRGFWIVPGALAIALASAPAAAAETGQYGDALRTMLTDVAAGTCTEALMGAQLLAACREQMPNMRPPLVAAGGVKSMTFVAAEGMGGDRMETYKIAFAKGDTSTWHIGRFRDGKFQSTYNIGE